MFAPILFVKTIQVERPWEDFIELARLVTSFIFAPKVILEYCTIAHLKNDTSRLSKENNTSS